MPLANRSELNYKVLYNRSPQSRASITSPHHYSSHHRLSTHLPLPQSSKNLVNNQDLSYIQNLKRDISLFINNQFNDYQRCGNISALKNSSIQKIQYQSHTIQLVLSTFSSFLKHIYSFTSIKRFPSMSEQFISNSNPPPDHFHNLFKQEYQALVEQNKQLIIRMNQQLSNQRNQILNYQNSLESLENQNFTLKNQLQANSKKSLLIELQRLQLLQTLQSFNQNTSKPLISSFNHKNLLNNYFEPKCPKVITVKPNPIGQKRKDNKTVSEEKPVFNTKSKQKTPPKESPFNFKPCLQLWKRQGIHKEKIQQLTECKECKLYLKQIQILQTKIHSLQKQSQ